jgi:DNA repair protein RadC
MPRAEASIAFKASRILMVTVIEAFRAIVGLGSPKAERSKVARAEHDVQAERDGASVHPREVVKEALKQNAEAVILAHPHPSGVAEPSQADEFITQRLKEALGLVDIRVLDHIIVAGGDTISLAERGLL